MLIIWKHCQAIQRSTCLQSCAAMNRTLFNQLLSPFLHSSCSIRFPSTNIKIQFENLIDQANNGGISIDLNQHTPIKVGTGTVGSAAAAAAAIAAAGGNLSSAGGGGGGGGQKSPPSPNVVYSPLKISIPEQATSGGNPNLAVEIRGHHPGALRDVHVGGSGYPSPTGTISAANSCPTSPRQNATHEFPQYSHNSHSSNNNNYSVSSGFFLTGRCSAIDQALLDFCSRNSKHPHLSRRPAAPTVTNRRTATPS